MERVAKRFLLHNIREREDVKESDFNELKQDMQMVRHELANDVNLFASNLVNYTAMLHRGICLLCEYFFQNDTSSDISSRYRVFQMQTSHFQQELDQVSLDADVTNKSINSNKLDDEA